MSSAFIYYRYRYIIWKPLCYSVSILISSLHPHRYDPCRNHVEFKFLIIYSTLKFGQNDLIKMKNHLDGLTPSTMEKVDT
jgi:hypothetical protein